jgi:hypothetical protein
MAFSKLPQDMLQHEINRFLDPISRVSFNAVLKPEERVYKKFCADYSLKHEIKTLRRTYKIQLQRINEWLDDAEHTYSSSKSLSKRIVGLIHWLAVPRHAILIMYRAGIKAKIMNLLEMFMEESVENGGDMWYYDIIAGYRVQHIQEAARLSYDALQKIEFVRHVRY